MVTPVIEHSTKTIPTNPPEIFELPVGKPCSEDFLCYEAKPVYDAFFEIANREK